MCVKSSLPISEPPRFCLVQIEGVSNTEIELHPVMETSSHNGAVSSNEPVVCVWRGGGGVGEGWGWGGSKSSPAGVCACARYMYDI